MNKEMSQPGTINLAFVEELYASYLRDRRTAIDEGVEALSSSHTGAAPAGAPGSYGSLRSGILREQRRTNQRATMWTELWKQ